MLRSDGAAHSHYLFRQLNGDLGGAVPFLAGFRENFGVHMRIADVTEHHKLIAKVLSEDVAIDRKDFAVAFQGDRVISGQNHESGVAQALVNALRQAVPGLPESFTVS